MTNPNPREYPVSYSQEHQSLMVEVRDWEGSAKGLVSFAHTVGAYRLSAGGEERYVVQLPGQSAKLYTWEELETAWVK